MAGIGRFVSMGFQPPLRSLNNSRWSPVLLLVVAAVAVALLANALAGWTVAVFLALTVLLGGLAVIAINGRT